MKTVVIFGGSGFIGQHLIRRIAKKGYKIIVPYQSLTSEPELKLLGTLGQIYPLKYKSVDNAIIIQQIELADVVINLKTLWNEKQTTFKQGILNFNKKIAEFILKSKKNKQYIYFSGIGIDKNSDSKRSRMIYQTEEYIIKNISNSVIVRPGVVIGGGDQLINKLLPLFKISFFIPLFGNGEKKLQPIYIDDLAFSITKIIDEWPKGSHIFELAGNDIFSYKELYKLIASYLGVKRFFVPVPFFIIKIIVWLLELTPFSPVYLEQLKLLESDSVLKETDKKIDNLNIYAQDTKEIIRRIIRKNT